MRDLFVFITIFGSLPFCLMRPWIGVLVFAWISYMNPHRYTWGPAFDYPFAKIVAIVTIVGLLFTKDKMPLPKTRETILIILLGLYFTFTNYYAFNPGMAWFQWEKVIKILAMTLVTMILINDQTKLKYFVMVIAFSIGLVGVKGAIFSIMTGGQHIVFGPPGSFLADNNDMALALNMTLPLLFYLGKEETMKQWKITFRVTFVMSIISVIFTYSRGGFLTLAVVLFFLLIMSKRKAVAGVVLTIVIIVGISFIPAEWSTRMETIKTYEEDSSAMGRINAWWMAYNLAKDRPLTGGGFETFTWPQFLKYAPDPDDVHDVHSIYFEILGEHGFVAFGMFIALIVFTLSTARKAKKFTRDHDNLGWVENYSNMLQVSLAAYMVGGLFLGRAYFDFFYHIVAIVVIMNVLAIKEIATAVAGRSNDGIKFRLPGNIPDRKMHISPRS